MATTRLLRSSNKPLGRSFASSSSWPSLTSVNTVRCISNGGLDGEKKACVSNSERKPTVVVKASVAAAAAETSAVISKPLVEYWGRELASLLANALNAMRQVILGPVVKPIRPWKSHLQMLIEKVHIYNTYSVNYIFNYHFFETEQENL